MNTIAKNVSTLETAFRSLADQWQMETQFSSDPADATNHPAYQAIIRMGPEVVPLILAVLAVSPAPWFVALRELTGENPVPPEDMYRPRVAAAHWLAWGHARGAYPR